MDSGEHSYGVMTWACDNLYSSAVICSAQLISIPIDIWLTWLQVQVYGLIVFEYLNEQIELTKRMHLNYHKNSRTQFQFNRNHIQIRLFNSVISILLKQIFFVCDDFKWKYNLINKMMLKSAIWSMPQFFQRSFNSRAFSPLIFSKWPINMEKTQEGNPIYRSNGIPCEGWRARACARPHD